MDNGVLCGTVIEETAYNVLNIPFVANHGFRCIGFPSPSCSECREVFKEMFVEFLQLRGQDYEY